MNTTKITSLVLPLLVSILLFTVSNLKLGLFLNELIKNTFYPITTPTIKTRNYLTNKAKYLNTLPVVEKQNREQKFLIAHLVWENENLKQAIKDSKTQVSLSQSYHKVLPIKISGSSSKLIATSSLPLSEVKPGMVVVSGNILLGLVTNISQNSISLISVEDDLFPTISLRTSSGPKGSFKHTNTTSQIINVPSQTPLILGDFVLTEATDLIPPNLLVGKITKILSNTQDPLQKGEVSIYDSIQTTQNNLVVIIEP